MLEKFREKRNEESGFTLVELLVVMLILGILAAIAIPSFFAQRDKATDAEAKSAVKTAQTSIETYATDNDGKYTGATVAALELIEPTLPAAPKLSIVSATDATYEVSIDSDRTGVNTFSISRIAGGNTTQTCSEASKGGCGLGTW